MTQRMEQTPQQPISAEEAKEKAKEKGQELKTQATERARQEVDSRSAQAAQQVQSFAQTLRRSSAELRAQGQEGQATSLDQVALRAEQLGGYLTQADPDNLLDDAKQYGSRAKEFARQQPWLVTGGGLILGVVISRALKSATSS